MSLFPLIHDLRWDEDEFIAALSRWGTSFCKAEDARPEEPEHAELRGMLMAFLGVDIDGLHTAIHHSGFSDHLARLMNSCLYLPAAQSNDKDAPLHVVTCLKAIFASDGEQRNAHLNHLLTKYAYLPGYGLTGWVLRYKTHVHLATTDVSSITSFHDDVCNNLVTWPAVRAIVRTLELIGVQTRLHESQLVPPVAAGHVRDAPKHRAETDAFEAYPLEEIDSVEFPGGVLRASATALRAAFFEPRAPILMQDTARHLSWVLRRSYMLGERFTMAISEAELIRDHLYHKVERYRPIANNLKETIANGTIAQQRQLVDDARIALSELCARVDGIRKQYIGARRLCSAHWTTHEELKAGMQSFLPESMQGIDISFKLAEQAKNTSACVNLPKCALYICLLVDEIICNDLKHIQNPPTSIGVQINAAPELTVNVLMPRGVHQPSERLEFTDETLPYARLLHKDGQHSGGGSLLLYKATTTTHLNVTYGSLKPSGNRYVISCHGCPNLQQAKKEIE
jgi:hypothetical protein